MLGRLEEEGPTRGAAPFPYPELQDLGGLERASLPERGVLIHEAFALVQDESVVEELGSCGASGLQLEDVVVQHLAVRVPLETVEEGRVQPGGNL
jgi:hypothetical protein